jgi:tetratricopeptide (TPR) repeat protein
MKRIILAFCAIVCCGVSGAAAETAPAMFNQANAAFEKGQYTEAAAMYESLAGRYGGNAALYFNLGNTYFRQQQMGKALLNYERAKRLAPRDRDVSYNLEFVRQQVKEPQQPFAVALLSALNGLATLNEVTALCSFCFIGFLLGGTAWIFYRQRFILPTLAAFMLFILATGWLFLKINAEVWTAEGIVTTGPAEVRNGPGMENSVGFSLSEGREVVVLGENNDWVAVGLSSEGLRGWIEKKYVEKI